MKKIYANNLTTLSLGRQGENLARQVVFDIRDLESLYGSGTVESIHQRPGDAQPYPLAVQRDGTLVTWDVTATDTEMDGYGKCELRYYVGETLAKSQIWRTWVESAMGTPSETTPPEPEQGWVDQVLAVGVSVKEATDIAKTYSNSAEQSASGAAQSAQEAAGSASAASTSATNAKASEESAAESASAAANSAASASASASAASESADAAAASKTAAKSSEEAAKASETAAKASDTAAAESASTAQQSATSAAESAAVYDNVVTDVNQLKQDLSDLDESLFTTEIIESKNYFDVSKITTGKYVASTGNLGANSAYNASDYTSVKEGETYTYQLGNTDASSRRIVTLNQIAGYDENKEFVNGSYQTYGNTYTVPSGVKYVRFSVDAGNMVSEKKCAFVKSTSVIGYNDYSEDITVKHFNQSLIKRDVKNGVTYDFNINNSNFESDVEFQHMCANRISFRADISTFNEIRIGKGYQAYMGATLGIDNTNIYVYEGASTNPYITEPHGLTFKDYISLVISCDYGNVASVTIYTNGGKFTRQYFAWDARKGKFFVKSIGTNVLNNCTFGYYCYALETPTYMYGDSYFTNAQGVTNRWTSYLIGGKNTNYLLNGYSGRASNEALKSLKTDLEYGTPKRIIWCLGMNNADSDTAINESWLSCVEELMGICAEKNIELILATIPNVPTINNSFKNEYVRNSGYRFINFAKAVGADSDTTWYDNMLSSDGVHPDVQGAIALYSQAVANVPELLS